MATFTWKAGTDGDWSTTSDWTPTSGAPPGSVQADTDVAMLLGATTAYTVTIDIGERFDLATLDIAGPSAAHPTTLSISGALLTDTLDYTGGGGAGKDAIIDVNAGGQFDIRSTIIASHKETITNTGGAVFLGSPGNSGIDINNTNVTFSFADTAGGVIEYLGPFFTTDSVANQAITGATAGDSLVFVGADFSGDTFTYSGTTLTVKSGTTTVLTMTNLTGTPTLVSADFKGVNGTIEIVCFAAGTRIHTPTGEKLVEGLIPGDIVCTLADGQVSARPVKWVGRRRIDLTAHPRPEVVAPVRIQRGAFAEDVPHTDLLLSPDHAIFVDDKLICARQLINGRTIRQEKDLSSIEYFHIELESHVILLAEGLTVESYLNTGNQGFFANSDEPLVLHPDMTDESDYPAREAGSCAPFVWDEASVRPVWQRLADRATAFGRPVPQRVTTTEPNLRLVSKSPRNRSAKPIHSDSNLVLFALPRGEKEFRLVSRAQSPTEARPWLEDRRKLGVRVKRIVLRGADELHEIPVDHPSLANGWWAVERDGQVMRRWTNGDAVLPLPAMADDVILEIHLADAMTYVVEAEMPDMGRTAA